MCLMQNEVKWNSPLPSARQPAPLCTINSPNSTSSQTPWPTCHKKFPPPRCLVHFTGMRARHQRERAASPRFDIHQISRQSSGCRGGRAACWLAHQLSGRDQGSSWQWLHAGTFFFPFFPSPAQSQRWSAGAWRCKLLLTRRRTHSRVQQLLIYARKSVFDIRHSEKRLKVWGAFFPPLKHIKDTPPSHI